MWNFNNGLLWWERLVVNWVGFPSDSGNHHCFPMVLIFMWTRNTSLLYIILAFSCSNKGINSCSFFICIYYSVFVFTVQSLHFCSKENVGTSRETDVRETGRCPGGRNSLLKETDVSIDNWNAMKYALGLLFTSFLPPNQPHHLIKATNNLPKAKFNTFFCLSCPHGCISHRGLFPFFQISFGSWFS